MLTDDLGKIRLQMLIELNRGMALGFLRGSIRSLVSRHHYSQLPVANARFRSCNSSISHLNRVSLHPYNGQERSRSGIFLGNTVPTGVSIFWNRQSTRRLNSPKSRIWLYEFAQIAQGNKMGDIKRGVLWAMMAVIMRIVYTLCRPISQNYEYNLSSLFFAALPTFNPIPICPTSAARDTSPT